MAWIMESQGSHWALHAGVGLGGLRTSGLRGCWVVPHCAGDPL